MTGTDALSTDEALAALAERGVDISRRTLTNWRKAGCPCTKRGTSRTSPLEWDLDQVLTWMRNVGRTGERGRPSDGTHDAQEDLLDGAGPTPGGADDERASLRLLTQRVNLEIKQWEARKRERIEAVATGDLHSVDECRARTLRKIHAVKAGLLTLANGVAQEGAGLGYEELRRVVERRVHALLTEFAGGAA